MQKHGEKNAHISGVCLYLRSLYYNVCFSVNFFPIPSLSRLFPNSMSMIIPQLAVMRHDNFRRN